MMDMDRIYPNRTRVMVCKACGGERLIDIVPMTAKSTVAAMAKVFVCKACLSKVRQGCAVVYNETEVQS